MSSDTEAFMRNKEAFVVEEILNVRRRNGRKEYLLKWKNFSDDENSWEPEANLNCPDLIDRFNMKQFLARGQQLKATAAAITSSALFQQSQPTATSSTEAISPLIRDRSAITEKSGDPTNEKTEKISNSSTRAKPPEPVKAVGEPAKENDVENAAAPTTSRVTRRAMKDNGLAYKMAAAAPSTSRAAGGNPTRSTKSDKDAGDGKVASAASSSKTAASEARMITRSASAVSNEVEAIIGCTRSSNGPLMLLVKYKYQSVAKNESIYDVHARHPLLVLNFLAERISPVFIG